jgi:diguanylate cyclase
MTDSSTPAPLDERAAADALGDAAQRTRALRFVARIHWMRTLGLGLGFFCVASVLRLHDEPWHLWALLVLNAFAWPHVAWLIASRGADPAALERHNLTIDSALGGAWIALMQFSLLPSVLLATMLVVDKIGAGGFRFAARNAAVLAGACLVTSAALGFAIDLATPMSVVVGSVPFLVAYPIAISSVMRTLAVRVAQQNRWLAHVSSTDELTGLANRRHGLAIAQHALALQRRHGGSAVLVVVDLDHFKQVNDRYGHAAGDEVLREVARTLREAIRVTDTAARYGGDEFLLVLPATTLEGANELTKRIHAKLAAAVFEHASDLRVTLSFGAAEAHVEMADVEDWIQQADAALYRAKEAGGDRLVSAPRVEGNTHDRSPPLAKAS